LADHLFPFALSLSVNPAPSFSLRLGGGYRIEEIDAQELSERIAEAARLRRASRGGVTPDIRVNQPTAVQDGRLRLRLSPRRLEQVLENLIDNALCFSPPGGTVAVLIDRRPGWAVIRIQDRGPGIPPQHLSRIFDRFFSYRPEAASAGGPADRLEHPGLGLAIVKAIVEGYGGTVTAANREGGGASFEVRLPLLRGARRSGAGEAAE
jgi:two-component system sensor histidine kinase ChvG